MKLKPFFWPKILDNTVSCVDYDCCKIRGAPPSLTFPLLSLFYLYPQYTPAFLSSFVWFVLTYDISRQLYYSVHRYRGQGAAWHCRKRFNAPHPQRLVYRHVSWCHCCRHHYCHWRRNQWLIFVSVEVMRLEELLAWQTCWSCSQACLAGVFNKMVGAPQQVCHASNSSNLMTSTETKINHWFLLQWQ